MKHHNIKIIALGAATIDIFLGGTTLTGKCDPKRGCYEEFALGEKIEIEEFTQTTGGGATNAAVTFARHGFESTILTKVGDDDAGQEAVRTLRAEGIHTRRVAVDIRGKTGYSTILLAPNGERSVLVYRGVSENLEFSDFNFESLGADWLYISSLAGNLKLLSQVLNWAEKENVKVAIDPGSKELAQAPALRKLLPKITLIKGNKNELAQLFESDDPKQVLERAIKTCQFAIVSDGKNGSWATDSQNIIHAGMYDDVKVIDRTGAGDAFGSGFVASVAAGKSLEDAALFASANATSVVQSIGAKAGILHANAKIHKMPVKVSAAIKA